VLKPDLGRLPAQFLEEFPECLVRRRICLAPGVRFHEGEQGVERPILSSGGEQARPARQQARGIALVVAL
jgi:hypothetical protein